MRKIYLSFVVILISSTLGLAQLHESGDKRIEMSLLQGQYSDILRSSLSDVRDAVVPVYMGSDTVNSTIIYDSIPFSTYQLRYETLKDFKIKHSIVDANAFEITTGRINFFCKNHMIIDSNKIIFSIAISDLKKVKKDQLCRKIFLGFFYMVYFKELSFNRFSVVRHNDFGDIEQLIEAAAYKFVQVVNSKKVWVYEGLTEIKTNVIPADSIYSKEDAQLTFSYKFIEKSNDEFSLVIDKIGFYFINKYRIRSFETPSNSYYATPKTLKKILGEDFTFFLLKGISQSFYNAILIY